MMEFLFISLEINVLIFNRYGKKSSETYVNFIFNRYGRRPIFFISLVMLVAFGVLAGFAPDIWTFSALRLLIGAATTGVFLVAYVLGKLLFSHESM